MPDKKPDETDWRFIIAFCVVVILVAYVPFRKVGRTVVENTQAHQMFRLEMAVRYDNVSEFEDAAARLDAWNNTDYVCKAMKWALAEPVHPEIVRFLVEHKHVDINRYGYAAYNLPHGINGRAVHALITNGLILSDLPQYIGRFECDSDNMVDAEQIPLDAKFAPHAITLLAFAARANQLDEVKWLVEELHVDARDTTPVLFQGCRYISLGPHGVLEDCPISLTRFEPLATHAIDSRSYNVIYYLSQHGTDFSEYCAQLAELFGAFSTFWTDHEALGCAASSDQMHQAALRTAIDAGNIKNVQELLDKVDAPILPESLRDVLGSNAHKLAPSLFALLMAKYTLSLERRYAREDITTYYTALLNADIEWRVEEWFRIRRAVFGAVRHPQHAQLVRGWVDAQWALMSTYKDAGIEDAILDTARKTFQAHMCLIGNPCCEHWMPLCFMVVTPE